MSTPAEAQQRTVEALLAASRRKGSVPISRKFVQRGTQKAPVPGPLQGIVKAHDTRALDLFLIHRAAASGGAWDVARAGTVWARILGLPDSPSGAQAVSKAFARLDKRDRLVQRARAGRKSKVTSLSEDGSGAAYTPPETEYFKLPYEYWTSKDRWYAQLTLPAKATLLIALSLPNSFLLPTEKAAPWYGLSTDTVERGLRELQSAGLLWRDKIMRENWLESNVQSFEFRYTLMGVFAHGRASAVSRAPDNVVGATQ